MSNPPQQLLVVGATGSIGRHVVAHAHASGLKVRALVRDTRRAEQQLPGTELVVGDLEAASTLSSAVSGVDAIVFTHGGPGDADSARRIDYGGVATVLQALDGRRPRLALMTSINVTRPTGSYAELLSWKRRSERVVRASGSPYTIIRPGWFDSVSPGDDRLVFAQGDARSGGVGRDQLADVLVRSLISDSAIGRTFELLAESGPAPQDLEPLFGAVPLDPEGSLDAAADPSTLPPLEQEPAAVRNDITELLAQRGWS